MNELPNETAERPHPGDTSPAEARLALRRMGLGLVIALSVNVAFLSAGAAIANYVAAIFRPLFFKDKIVYVTLDVPTPTDSPTPAAPKPAPR